MLELVFYPQIFSFIIELTRVFEGRQLRVDMDEQRQIGVLYDVMEFLDKKCTSRAVDGALLHALWNCLFTLTKKIDNAVLYNYFAQRYFMIVKTKSETLEKRRNMTMWNADGTRMRLPRNNGTSTSNSSPSSMYLPFWPGVPAEFIRLLQCIPDFTEIQDFVMT